MKNKERNINLDIIRSIAFFCLISVHFFLNTGFYDTLVNSNKIYLAVIIRMFSMSCIPLFLMLTGFLKLNKQFDKKYYLGLVRILTLYALAMVFNYTSYHFLRGEELTIPSLIKNILAFRDSAWYIGMYIGLYLLSPFLNKLFKNLSNQEQKYLIYTLLVTVSLPTLTNIFGIQILPAWWTAFYPILYYILGCYLCAQKSNPLKREREREREFLLLAIITTAVVSLLLSKDKLFSFSAWNDWASPLIVFLSYTIFNFFLNLKTKNLKKFVGKIFIFISTFSFVGYLVSPVVEYIIYKKLSLITPDFRTRFNYYIPSILIIAIVALALSFIITKTHEIIAKRGLKILFIFISSVIILCPIIASGIDYYKTKDDWKKYSKSQILGDSETGSLFDPYCLIDDQAKYRCYASKRNEGSIVVYFSNDGINFDKNYKTIIKSDDTSKYLYNRATVLVKDNKYYMYYTKQWDEENSAIFMGVSQDGINFDFYQDAILSATLDFEDKSVMNPNVIYDEHSEQYIMYYAAGEIYEPDYIGRATSRDGVHFEKMDHPILEKNPDLNSLDFFKVGAVDVKYIDETYYMFYIGYTDINTGRIILTTSQDGINFNRSYYKVIAQPDPNGFDKDSVYKASVVHDKKHNRWLLYYNGRTEDEEYIGLYIKNNNLI